MDKELWIKIIIFILVAILLIFEGIDTLPVVLEGIGTSPGPIVMIITKIVVLILVWTIIVIERRKKRPKIQG